MYYLIVHRIFDDCEIISGLKFKIVILNKWMYNKEKAYEMTKLSMVHK